MSADAIAALAGYLINANRLGKAVLTARYGRRAAKGKQQYACWGKAP